MIRSTSRWATTLAAAAVLTLPASAGAQPPTTPEPEIHQKSTPQEHLQKAEAALEDIQPASIPSEAQQRINQLKQHVNRLEQAAASTEAPARASWSADVAAVDRLVMELIGGPGATSIGTSGTSSQQPMEIDAETRRKLMDVRTQVTLFAAAMQGATPSAEPEPAAPGGARPTVPSQPPTGTEPPTGTKPPMGSDPPAATQPPAGTEPPSSAQPPSSTQPPASGGATPIDQETARHHLTQAREALSALTQLPAASQLTGDARTQVSQLISNFNELITNKTDWRASYTKVEANVNTLLGNQSTDESAARTSGTAGAVGTAGSVSLDPEIRAKLMEFRNSLEEFEKAAGGTAPGQPGEAPDPAATAAPPSAAPAPESAAGDPSLANREEIVEHIQAIEAILTAQSASAAAAGTPGAPGAAVTLSTTDVQQLRSHLNQLKALIDR